MKIKTSELTGAALDWAVAVALSHKVTLLSREDIISFDPEMDDEEKASHRSKPPRVRIEYGPCPMYSTAWAQGGPILESEKIETTPWGQSEWRARSNWNASYATWVHVTMFETFGPTPLVAGLRCYVTSELGDEVDVPKELL